MYYSRIILFLFFIFSAVNLRSQDINSIIPKPVLVQKRDGVFQLNTKTTIWIDSTEMNIGSVAMMLTTQINRSSGIDLSIFTTEVKKTRMNAIMFFYSPYEIKEQEGYRLEVAPSGIRIFYRSEAGAFYALQTLFQLMPAGIYSGQKNFQSTVNIPCCRIEDYPRFSYRGMHLDVCRHFFPVEFIKKYIDLMAMHKMNTFHWHLTEDQGWRIEIKKYPELISIGSNRKESMIGFYDEHKFDGTPYGGFYTQDEIREVVAYAQQRYVTIIPEIEMPGHSRAALAAYPELGCTPEPVEVATEWGVFNEVFCPTEKTFSFLEDVLTEVCSLFPGTYIHIGGDECPKVNWRASDYCQQLMKKENLKDEMELQSYFIRRIEKFLILKGKKLIGWDEILEGGLAPDATVMSWRGVEGGIAAARQGHDVVMTPGSHCYFDHYQSDPSTEPLAIGGYTTLQKVYSYEPIPIDSLSKEQQKYILGAQGNVWTEYITESRQVEYMAYPRACALAEVLWSPIESRNWDDFSDRIQKHFVRLDSMHVNYSKAIYDLTASVSSDTITKSLMVSIQKYINQGQIYYTLDGNEPEYESAEYTGPIEITNSTSIRAGLLKDAMRGKVLDRDYYIHKATALPYQLKDTWKQYDGASAFGLTDGVYGKLNQYNTWVGFSGKDLDLTLDLHKVQELNRLAINFYNKDRSWIFLPASVTFYISMDGLQYQQVYQTMSLHDTLVNSIVPVTVLIDKMQARFIRVVAANIGKCPIGHPGEGKDAWLFADEIVVE